jgi:hypothetical protein
MVTCPQQPAKQKIKELEQVIKELEKTEKNSKRSS